MARVALRMTMDLDNMKAEKADENRCDENLIALFVGGSGEAFDTLVQRYKKRIFAYIYFQISHQQDSEDLTQDVFVQIYRTAQNFRAEAAFSSFIYAIARNIVFNYYRANKRTIVKQKDAGNTAIDINIYERDDTLIEADSEQNLNAQINAQINTHANELFNAQGQEKSIQVAISKAIHQLSVDDRQLLYLADRENYTYLQISNIVGINIGTVRSRLNSARTKLIKILRENLHELY